MGRTGSWRGSYDGLLDGVAVIAYAACVWVDLSPPPYRQLAPLNTVLLLLSFLSCSSSRHNKQEITYYFVNLVNHLGFLLIMNLESGIFGCTSICLMLVGWWKLGGGAGSYETGRLEEFWTHLLGWCWGILDHVELCKVQLGMRFWLFWWRLLD